MFARHPEFVLSELATQSYFPLLHWILPQAFSQTPQPQAFVYGTIKTKNIDNVLTGADSVRACIYEINVDTGIEIPFVDSNGDNMCEYTSDAGNFSFVIPQNDPDDGGTVDVMVKAQLKHNNFEITDFDDAIFTISGDTYENISRTIFNYGTISPDGNTIDNFSRASWIYDTMDMGWNYFKNTVNYKPPYVQVKWGSDRHVSTEYEHHDPKEPVFIQLNKIVNLDFDAFMPDEESPATILHEYGHFIHHQVYDDNGSRFPGDSSNCVKHYVYTTSDKECAWVEGWAHFAALAVLDSPNVKYSRYQYPINFEIGQYNINSDIIGQGDPFENGSKVEGRIASTLWDIYDSTNEPGDNISNGLSSIWNTFSDDLEVPEDLGIVAQLFSDFVNDWNDNSYQNLDNILFLNTIITSKDTDGDGVNDSVSAPADAFISANISPLYVVRNIIPTLAASIC